MATTTTKRAPIKKTAVAGAVKKTRAKAAPADAAAPAKKKKLFSLELIKKNQFKDLGELNGNQTKKVHEALNYIEMLGTTTGTDLSGMDVFDVFGGGTNNIATSQEAINKLFFEYIEQKAKEPKPVVEGVVQLSEAMLKQIDEVTKAVANNGIERIKNDLRGNQQRTRQYQDEVDRLIALMYEQQVQIDCYKPESSKMGAQIQEILAEGFWKFQAFNNNKLRITTVADIVNTHKEGTTEIQVNLGKFMAEIDLARMNLKVYPFENNLGANGFCHPHVNQGGGLCWGNASNTATRHLQTGQLIPLFKLLAALLTTYNHSGPYIALNAFVKARKMSDKTITARQAGRDGDF